MSILSNVFVPFRVYNLKPSLFLRLSLLLFPLLAFLALYTATGHRPEIFTVGVVGLLAVTLWSWVEHWPGAALAPTSLSLDADGGCQIELSNGRQVAGAVIDQLAIPGLIIVAVARRGLRRVVVIPGDALGGEAHRELRRRLRSH